MKAVKCRYYENGKCIANTSGTETCFACAKHRQGCNLPCVLLCDCEEETCNIGELIEERVNYDIE